VAAQVVIKVHVDTNVCAWQLIQPQIGLHLAMVLRGLVKDSEVRVPFERFCCACPDRAL
jgi:hypothetical protein